MALQQTVAHEFSVLGFGVHRGEPVTLSVKPAPCDHGIVFLRHDGAGRKQRIAAHASALGSTALNTSIGPEDFGVSTIEHLMAAISALNIDNLLIEIDGPEVPILGGGSAEFVEAFQQAGLIAQDKARQFITITAAVRVEEGENWAEFVPYQGTRYEVEIDFPVAAIGRQSFNFDADAAIFARDIAKARTFGFMRDVEKLRAMGLALGSSLQNSIAIADDGSVINPEGLFYRDEFVRHKLLDAIGDLALAGHPFRGKFRSYRGGHKLNAALVKALLAQPQSYILEV